MKFLLITIGLLVFLMTIRTIFTSGIHNNTSIFLGGISIAIFAYCFFYEKLRKQKWLTISICVAIAAVFVFSFSLFAYGRRTTATFDEEIIIVLGAGLRDGTPLPTLARRLDAAFSYYQQNPDVIIFVSGGLGHRQEVTEAQAMAQHLIHLGINPDRIILENYSYSTYSNFRYTKGLIAEQFDHMPTVAIITSNFHMYRAVRFAKQVGIEASIYPASVPATAIPLAYVREVASVIKLWVLGR